MAPIFPKLMKPAPDTTPTGGTAGTQPKGTLNVYKLPADSNVTIYADGKPIGADVPFSEALEGKGNVVGMRFTSRRIPVAPHAPATSLQDALAQLDDTQLHELGLHDTPHPTHHGNIPMVMYEHMARRARTHAVLWWWHRASAVLLVITFIALFMWG